jgi:hypothetical protein|tara:strand:- start:15 stop:152 length:138 start_codon:yes stop_codon:yes gene_type:complete
VVAWLKNKILAWIETTSGKINVWVWHKRWDKKNRNKKHILKIIED